jgi:hypothetical protein
MRHEVAGLARHHWFYLSLPLLLSAALGFRASHPWSEQPALCEAVTLFDWCLFVPILYVLCYRDMPRRALVLRALALACGGIWIASRIVPDSAETILSEWGWLRGLGIAVLVIFEGLAGMAMLRVVFSAAPDLKVLERQGIPPLFVKLMLAEVRLWRWVWMRLRGL